MGMKTHIVSINKRFINQIIILHHNHIISSIFKLNLQNKLDKELARYLL